jgi:peptidoglycan/LPS O-acetylase OafA/YrhL
MVPNIFNLENTKFYITALGQIVDVFFCISGMLNFLSLVNRPPSSILKAYFIRVLRIYPVFLVATVYWWKLHRYMTYAV